MSQPTILKLRRRDKISKVDSYLKIYETHILPYVDNKYHINILRIIKKAILGSNFYYFYSKNNIFASAIANFVIINTFFVIFPQIIFNSISILEVYDDIEKITITDNKNIYEERNNFLLRLSISNFIDISILLFMSLLYKYKEKKINNYMKKYTQCALREENDILIKNKYFCEISNDEFDIDIKKIKNNFNLEKNREEYFFKYVINFPNVRGISKYLYYKSFSVKEKEIINNINSICDEIDFRHKKKLIKFTIVIVSILISIPIFSYFSAKNKLDMINYFGIFSLFLFVQFNTFLINKKEQINYVNLLNDKYFKDGYFIYINNDIISIFYLKEEYQRNRDISQIRKMNEKFLEKNEINF